MHKKQQLTLKINKYLMSCGYSINLQVLSNLSAILLPEEIIELEKEKPEIESEQENINITV